MSTNPVGARTLEHLTPSAPYFVGIDSDGCAFDTMEIKHKECFCPNTIKWWRLQAVSKYAREAVEFVNLYSKWRGINRWPALVKVFDLLRQRPEVRARQVEIPEALGLRQFVAQKQFPLSNDGLRSFRARAGPLDELRTAWNWTTGVNAAIEEMVRGVPPFRFVRDSLELMRGCADIVVVSATPTAALTREWEEHDIARYARYIAGQEQGTKAQHLARSATGKYPPGQILMIGDAPGDMEAARATGALFFPINPGAEEQSWERFYREGFARFVAGTYLGAYQASLTEEFERLLPAQPPWQVGD
jgi:phosphoglycolate phosphatase-like HAD superfamily hydrolase